MIIIRLKQQGDAIEQEVLPMIMFIKFCVVVNGKAKRARNLLKLKKRRTEALLISAHGQDIMDTMTRRTIMRRVNHIHESVIVALRSGLIDKFILHDVPPKRRRRA